MSKWGSFQGEVVAKWLREPDRPDRDMELVADFAYVDPDNVRWEAPTGSVINGASIPGIFWSKVGPPYVGNYRRASVLHDVACDEKSRPHEQVHRMFYYAMRCDGVSVLKAHMMYQAVDKFGPRWGTQETAPRFDAESMSLLDPEILESAVLTAFEELGDADLETVKNRVDALLG